MHTTKATPTPAEVKAHLKRTGWSYRRAGKQIGKAYQWVCLVVNGQATSAPVLRALAALPPANQ